MISVEPWFFRETGTGGEVDVFAPRVRYEYVLLPSRWPELRCVAARRRRGATVLFPILGRQAVCFCSLHFRVRVALSEGCVTSPPSRLNGRRRPLVRLIRAREMTTEEGIWGRVHHRSVSRCIRGSFPCLNFQASCEARVHLGL